MNWLGVIRSRQEQKAKGIAALQPVVLLTGLRIVSKPQSIAPSRSVTGVLRVADP
jgi:hypothetical protein